MILLNLTDEILENAKKEGWEVVEVEMSQMLKRNKYVGILSIAVTTLQYIMISMITIFSMYIAHVR